MGLINRAVVHSNLDDHFLTSCREQPPCLHLLFLPDLHTEVSRIWKNLYSAHVHTHTSLTYSTVAGMHEQGYGAMPKVEEMLADYFFPSTASSWRKPLSCTRPPTMPSGGISANPTTIDDLGSRDTQRFIRPILAQSL